MRQRKTDRQTKEVSQEHVERERGGEKRVRERRELEREREGAEKVRGGKQPLL